MRKQTGWTFWNILFMAVLLGSWIFIGIKVVPKYIEFFGVQKLMKDMANSGDLQGTTVQQIRQSFDKRASIAYIESITGADLDISKEDGRTVVTAAYQAKVPLFYNVSALLDFSASTGEGRLKE